MLNVFREHATSWIIKVALGLIIIVFIFWGGYAYQSKDETQMARVGERYISITEYDDSYRDMMEFYRRQLGDSFSSELIQQFNLKQQALDRLINQYVLTKAADELGLTASEQEVQQKILEYPAFLIDGKFDHKMYVSLLQQNRLTPEAFERQIMDQLSLSKLEDFIKRRVMVTDEEIRSDFEFTYGQVQLAYALLDPKSFESQVTMDDKSIQTYYQDHLDRYMDPEKRRFSYVMLKTDDFLGNIQVTEDEVRIYYEDYREKYRQEAEVKARHILFNVKEDAPQEEVDKLKTEAEKVLAEAKKGADFAELAKQHSQDPGSAKNGGDLGYFPRGRMVEAFSDAAFALKPGEISDLVRTPFGFHIIKVEDVREEKITPLEEAKAGIETTLKQERARDIAHGRALDFADMAYAQKDVEKAAQAKKLEPVVTDSWLARGDPLPGVNALSPDIVNKLFSLPEKGISDILETPQGFLVAQVTAVQQPRAIPFEKVKERVEADFKSEQARSLAQQKANDLLEAAKNAKNLEEAGKEKGVEVKKSGWFSRRQPDKDIRLTGETLNKVFQLQESQPFADAPLEAANRFMVAQLLGRQTPSADLEKEKASISKRLLAQKQRNVWQSWLEEQRRRTDIEVFREL